MRNSMKILEFGIMAGLENHDEKKIFFGKGRCSDGSEYIKSV